MHIYKFVSDDDTSDFCQRVTKALTEGWVLYGPPHYVFDAEAKKMRCGQAMTREVEDQPYDPDKKLADYQ